MLSQSNLLFVGRKPDRAIHNFTTLGVIELIFHRSSFLILDGKGCTVKTIINKSES